MRVVARLQRFYGGDPASWLSMPTGQMSAMFAAMPGIDAGERLAAHSILASAGGGMQKSDSTRLLASLRKMAARFDGSPTARKPQSFDDLAAIGVEVVR